MDANGYNPYRLAVALRERGVSMSTTYRAIEKEGRLRLFDGRLVAALRDELDVSLDELFELVTEKRGKR